MNKRDVIAFYLRLSVEDFDVDGTEKDESNSIENQRSLLHSFVDGSEEFQGCTVLELCDDGYSGTNTDRPAFQELVEKARRHEVGCIIVKDLSRFGRNYITVCDYIDQIFPFLGIRFISVNDGYDSRSCDGATSDIDVMFRNLVNDYYSKDISEKVRSGKRTRAENGKYISPFAPVGYRKDKRDKNQLVVDEESAEVVRRIFRLAGAGMSVLKITRLLNAEKVPTPSAMKKAQGLSHKWWDGPYAETLWGSNAVTLILRDERYLGKTVYGKRYRFEVGNRHTRKNQRDDWIIVENRHEPLVTPEEFQAAQEMLREYEEKESTLFPVHLFTGKLKCGECGYSLQRMLRPTPRYFCPTKYRTNELTCMKGHITEEVLSEVVFQAVTVYCKTLLDKCSQLKKAAKAFDRGKLERQLAEYAAAIASFDEQKALLYDKKLEGYLSKEQYVRKRDALTAQQEDLQREIRELEKQLLPVKRQDSYNAPPVELLEQCLKADHLTREMVVAFVKQICVYNDKAIHIDWLFDEKGVPNNAG